MHVAVVERAAVVRPHDEEADGLGVVLLEHVADQEEVAQALGHLLVVGHDEAVVHPVVGQRLAGCAFALRNFVLVMRELQVFAATMDVERFTQQLASHGRALDVPAGAARAELAGPLHFFGFARLGALPEHRVERIVLAVEHRHALARVQLVDGLAAELAVARKLAHRVVHVAVLRAVGQALLLERADHRQHLRDVVGGAGFVGGPLDAERIGIFVQRIDHAVGERTDGFAVLDRAANDLVVDIGDVAHVGHGQAAGLEPALHQVEGDHRARMAQMAEVIDRHAAHVHAHPARLQWGELLQFTRKRVVDAQTHEARKTSLRARAVRANDGVFQG